MDASLFDYTLPPDRIAQAPMEPRENAKLLVMDRKTGALTDKHIGDLPDLLKAGDLLIFNDSKVFKARLHAEVVSKYSRDVGLKVEIFLLRPDGDMWIAMARPGKKLHTGTKLLFEDGSKARVVGKRDDGTVDLDFGMAPGRVFGLADSYGEVPLPPYIEPTKENITMYQTVYAKNVGSVAAPTAGFHFTEDLIRRCEMRDVRCEFVTLHVGVGTFRPIKTDTLEAHEMHEEWAEVSAQTAEAIANAKREGRRVIVVGTTAMRAVETWASQNSEVKTQNAWEGFTKLFITPGYEFKIADGLITNFHLPKSTLIVLVSSFAGRENVMRAYDHAIKNGYRFYSFGDAMMVV